MDNDKIKIYGAKVYVDSIAVVADIEEVEKNRMREKTKKLWITVVMFLLIDN